MLPILRTRPAPVRPVTATKELFAAVAEPAAEDADVAALAADTAAAVAEAPALDAIVSM
jgi:hypothetical protein